MLGSLERVVGRSSRVARVLTITLEEDITKPLLLVNTFLKR